MSEEISEDMPEDILEEVTIEMSEDMSEDMSKREVRNMSDKNVRRYVRKECQKRMSE